MYISVSTSLFFFLAGKLVMERGFAGHDGNLIIFKLLLLSQGEFPGQKTEKLTALPLRVQICTQLFNELCASLITFPMFVRRQCLIARNVSELSSSNGALAHFYAA